MHIHTNIYPNNDVFKNYFSIFIKRSGDNKQISILFLRTIKLLSNAFKTSKCYRFTIEKC